LEAGRQSYIEITLQKIFQSGGKTRIIELPEKRGSYSSSVGKLDQAGKPASACTGLYRQKGKINPGDKGSQQKQLHIRGDTSTTNMHLPVLDPMVFLNIF
jgi:hypothetical protein